jgi:ASC-1-like (ASCH) protein
MQKKWILKFASYKTPNDIFDALKAGIKTVETRPATPKYQKIKSGDILVCVSLDTKEKVEKIVLRVRKYNSVKEMAVKEDPNKILPGVKTGEELEKIFKDFKRKWGKSYADKLDRFGVLVFEIN